MIVSAFLSIDLMRFIFLRYLLSLTIYRGTIDYTSFYLSVEFLSDNAGKNDLLGEDVFFCLNVLYF